MKIKYTSNQRYKIWILAVSLTTMIISISLFSSNVAVVNSYAQENEKTQNLTNTNIQNLSIFYHIFISSQIEIHI